MPLRAPILVALAIEDEIVVAVELGPVGEVGQRQIRPDAGVLDGDDVVGGAVLGIPGDLVRSELPPKTDPPEEIPHGLALHDIRWRHEGSQDHAPLAAVDDVVVVVAETNRAPVPHR